MRNLQALIKPIYSSVTQQIALKRGIGSFCPQKLHKGHTLCTAADVEIRPSESRAQADAELSWNEEPQRLIVVDDFLPEARDLRSHYDSRFRNPLDTHSSRFVWDYWHVPDQYTLLRTPADQFFPDDSYSALIDALQEFGEQQLGCRGISPVWLSYYVDGCRQELHTDSPHGPLAFVLSLTEWEGRTITGGETMLFQPHMLDFWSGHDPERGIEFRDMVTLVEPRFNRLIVFDGRYPHGVRMVEGTRDPVKARAVLHGWFNEPAPFFDGSLPEEAATEALQCALDDLYEDFSTLPPCVGTVIVRFTVSGTQGVVTDMRVLTDTLVPVPSGPGSTDARQLVFEAIQHHILEKAKFPLSSEGDTVITLPFIFQ